MSDLTKSRLRFGPFEVDLNTRELRKSGVRVKLSGQPFEILAALLARPGHLVTRDELRKRVWSEDTYVDFSHGLNAAVNKLREALCDSADDPRYIETLPRRGYRFIAVVQEVAATPSVHKPEAVASPPASNGSFEGEDRESDVPLGRQNLIQTWAVRPNPHDSPNAFPANSAARPSQPSWNPSLSEDWESTVPLKRGTLVQLLSIIAVTVLLTLGTTSFWSHLSDPRSPEEVESRLKQAVEPAAREMAERSLKELAGRSSSNGPATSAEPSPNAAMPSPVKQVDRAPENSEHAEVARKSVVEPGAADDSVLLRLTRSGHRLTFPQEGQSTESPAILRLDLSRAGNRSSLKPIIAGGGAIAGPQPSPDGKKLVFMAGTSNSMDLWVCNSDGSSPTRLTNTGKTGTPRWSPDGRWIAFDSDGRFGRSGIYVVSADGGSIRPLVEDHSNNSVPSWSRDGKYIYFASNRGDGWETDQVWKVPAAGGQPVQVTRHGGFSGFESLDGQAFYYAKHRYQNPEIWQVSPNGGTESRVSLLHPSTWASWAVTKTGILLLSEYTGQVSELQYFDFATHSIHSLATLEKASFWLASAANGSSIWYSELTDDQARQVFKAGLD